MSATALIIIVSVCFVGLFVLGMSLTLIFKGHHIKSEIGENENLRSLGLKCTAQQMLEEEALLRGKDISEILGCAEGVSCSSCAKYDSAGS